MHAKNDQLYIFSHDVDLQAKRIFRRKGSFPTLESKVAAKIKEYRQKNRKVSDRTIRKYTLLGKKNLLKYLEMEKESEFEGSIKMCKMMHYMYM
jgi:hypothetical protein